MLRDRLKRWRVDFKNKRSKPPSTFAVEQAADELVVSKESPAATLERPIATAANDVPQRQLLSTMNNYLEAAWERQLRIQDGGDLVDLLITLENAAKVAADAQSQEAWRTLRSAEYNLSKARWSRISPCMLVYMIRIIGEWGFELDKATRDVRSFIQAQISSVIGGNHPLALLMQAALSRQLGVEAYLSILTISKSKAEMRELEDEDRKDMEHYSRLAYIKVLSFFQQYKMMEENLESWSPTNATDQSYKLRRLAEAKVCLCKHQEAEKLYIEALDTFTAPHQLTEIIWGYVRTLYRQSRHEDACKVFLDGLITYDTEARKVLDPAERALDIEWFRMEAARFRYKYKCPEISRATALLTTMAVTREPEV